MLLQPTCACVVYFPICIVANNNNDMKIHLEFILALGRFLINSMFFFCIAKFFWILTRQIVMLLGP